MKTKSTIKFECSYHRGEAEIMVFETYSWQYVPVLINRCAKALLCFAWAGSSDKQKDYLSIQFRHEARRCPVVEEVARVCLAEDGRSLLWY